MFAFDAVVETHVLPFVNPSLRLVVSARPGRPLALRQDSTWRLWQRWQTSYTSTTLRLGVVDFPLRLVVPFAVSMAMVIGLQVFLSRTFFGRAVLAVAQDQLALRLMAINPVRVKEYAFALSIATAGVAGAFLIVIQPVQPSIGREYIGLVFAVCVLGGMGSLWGTLLGALILGLAESFTSTFFGPSWAPAVSFGTLLLALAFKPSGLLGR